MVKILPKNYKLRPIQVETLDIISNNLNEDFFILNLPTGVGKSLISETISLNYPTTIITKTKYLQDQYLNEFKYTNLKGKDNYTCKYGFRWRSKECLDHISKHGTKCKEKECPYHFAKKDFANSNKRLTNFAYFLKSGWINIDSIPPTATQFLIIDEAHNFGNEIISAMTMEFNYEKLSSEFFDYTTPGGIPALTFLERIDHFNKKLKEINKIPFLEIVKILRELIRIGFPKFNLNYIPKGYLSRDIWFYTLMEDFKNKFTELNNVLFLKWEENDQVILKPVYPKNFKSLWQNKAEKFIFMSATIGNKNFFEEEIGIKNSVYFEAESPFDKDKRPIVYKPLYNFVYREKENAIPILIKAVDRVIKKHKNENGIIHTPSFSLAWEIKKKSKYGKKMVIPKNPQEINNLKGKNKIIVGPNFYEGVDFKDDDARWQIIAKIPYLEITNPYVKYRMQHDKHWYTNETLKRLEQTIGRIVRNKDDYGVTYIFDLQFEKFIPYLPKFLKEALIRL